MSLPASIQLAVAMQASESVADVVNTAATAEAMAVTLLGAALKGAAGYDGGKGLPANIVAILKAAQSSEQAHYKFLTGAGAKPATTTFTIPDAKIASDSMTLYKTLESLETAFIAAYVAAAREFAGMNQPGLVKVALQIGGTEAEHRALARVAQGLDLPHNVAFEKAMFGQVTDAATALKNLGFVGGSGTQVRYDDFAGAVDNAGMTELTPGGVEASYLAAPAAAPAAPAPAGSAATPATASTSAQMPTALPRTGGLPLLPVLVAGAGLAALGHRVKKA